MRFMMYTDIHFGKKRGSDLHNQDCLDFIGWMLKEAKREKIDHIIFLGDFFDNRTTIDTRTLNYAQQGLEMINDAKHIKKVYHLVGNHDLHHRNNRSVNSLPHTTPLEKFELINEPVQHGELLFVPYLFKNEYDLMKDSDARFIFGHLEFDGFTMTGNYKMSNGYDSRYISSPDLVVSGHFHKRQMSRNVCFIGNVFPMDFSDTNDSARGAAILDTEKAKGDQLTFIDWPDCPVYIRCKLSELLNSHETILRKKASVECIIDEDISYIEAVEIRKTMMELYELRLFATKEQKAMDRDDAVEETETDIDMDIDIDMNGLVMKMLGEVNSDSINTIKLKAMYKEL